MKAMILKNVITPDWDKTPLELVDTPVPVANKNEILIRVKACGVCHTELDEIEGRALPSFFPVILGHQVVGTVVENGKNATKFRLNDRVGVGWFFSSCCKCRFCNEGLENLCFNFKATGRDANGGYAEYMCVPEDSAFYIPDTFSDAEAAPLLCGGAIGYRALKLSNLKDGYILGLTGFGASGHQVLQLAKYLYPSSHIFVFSRNEKEREFALNLGADWASDTSMQPPELIDSIIDTTPAWKPVVEALNFLKPGGRLVINAIRKEEKDKKFLMNLNYPQHLWLEKEVKSVANITKKDIGEFLSLAVKVKLKPTVQKYTLEEANKALWELKQGVLNGAKVLMIQEDSH